jgi:hypothetical protein
MAIERDRTVTASAGVRDGVSKTVFLKRKESGSYLKKGPR